MRQPEIDLEDRYPVGLDESSSGAPSAPPVEENANETHVDIQLSSQDPVVSLYESQDLDTVLRMLVDAVALAEEDRNAASMSITDLKQARSDLKKRSHTEDTRKQMKAKKAAIHLHLRYLEHTLSAYKEFDNHVAAGMALPSKDIKKVAIALLNVFHTSHERILSVLALPLDSAKAYTKSIGLRTGNTNKFFQNNPGVVAGGTIGAGVLAAAGLTLVIGPFSLIALALSVPAAYSVVEKQHHADTEALECLKKASLQMKHGDVRRDKDVKKLRNALECAATANKSRVLPQHMTISQVSQVD
ncbi:hypothetical protein PROFUN_11873 [Planoprotostelium fungivorum]|uniref:Uncharacterized protein n=1 Tax=Planoprotostelium fungivorum TaxID=1890364 RepID=A0A2P6N9E3_9EUKA|nr:hypothetical protein PROFUN_11873 [Planoprotostelium fungivorum]